MKKKLIVIKIKKKKFWTFFEAPTKFFWFSRKFSKRKVGSENFSSEKSEIREFSEIFCQSFWKFLKRIGNFFSLAQSKFWTGICRRSQIGAEGSKIAQICETTAGFLIPIKFLSSSKGRSSKNFWFDCKISKRVSTSKFIEEGSVRLARLYRIRYCRNSKIRARN